jgi:hypothetical protein
MKMSSNSKAKPNGRVRKARETSTQRALASMLLAFESFVVLFATLVAFGLKIAEPVAVWSVGLGLTLVMIATPAILGKKGSYVWGWILQGLTLLTGIWVPLMWLVGAIFVCLWAWAMIAGTTIDKARRAYLSMQAAAEEVITIVADDAK